uniref:START domain-containing protein n=1 Tax=Grammatophora oceanica TaxID=210454 RepID=A0A7S1V6X1_9STRA|mmetsp:Transcript_38303/g.56995  ORF Transcript_38303/g.56995 Transcript_38303/m.56995 type:complete len:994 (+) Transcript_38303:3-2984(+)
MVVESESADIVQAPSADTAAPVPAQSTAVAASVVTPNVVILEGTLLKRADRGLKWNDRYFVLKGNRLSYSKRKGERTKNAFVISSESSCEIGNLYMDQRQTGENKEILYCFKVTWNSSSRSGEDVLSLVDEERTTQAGGASAEFQGGLVSETTSPVENSPRREDDDPVVLAASTPSKKRTKVLRKMATPLISNKRKTTSVPAMPSVDNDRVVTLSHRPLSPCSPPLSPSSQQRDDISMLDTDSIMLPGAEEERPTLLTETPKDRGASLDHYYREESIQDQTEMLSIFRAAQKENKKKLQKKMVNGGKIAVATGAAVTLGVLTAGVGLVAGLAFLGASAAAGGTGVAAGAGYKITKRQRGVLVVATPNYDEARKWKSAMDACLFSERVKDSTWGQLFVSEGRSARTALLPTEIKLVPSARSDSLSPRNDDGARGPGKIAFGFRAGNDPGFIDPGTRWAPMDGGWTTLLGCGGQGLRISREDRTQYAMLNFEGRPSPPLKSQVVLNASPLHAFMCLMSWSRLAPRDPLEPMSEQRSSFRVLRKIDDNMDIIHLVYRPLYLFPSWTTPRDFVLFRYWRFEPDGTYVICYESVNHEECPPLVNKYVRGEMHAVYTIAPQKKHRRIPGEIENNPQCLLTCVVQVDPRGWIPLMPLSLLSNQGYGEGFTVSALLQLLDIRDALDRDRFAPTSMDSGTPTVQTGIRKQFKHMAPSLAQSSSVDYDDDHVNYDFSFAGHELSMGRKKGISATPPILSHDNWGEPNANSFRVRGKTYTKDKLKINAGSSIGRLIAVDVVGVDAPLYESGLSLHPTERMQLALQREKSMKERGQPSELPPFIFIVNIVLPGPPFYHGVFYYAIDDMSSIDGSDGTPSSKLCKQFFFGDSDEFRDKTFKLIPQIVEGNFMVRKAVGSTPAIMGTKLRQLYIQRQRFFEVILDCGSSAVATGVIRLSLGYAKTLVIDMGFLFEGYDETTLPERIFGCVRIKNLLFGPHLRKVEPP